MKKILSVTLLSMFMVGTLFAAGTVFAQDGMSDVLEYGDLGQDSAAFSTATSSSHYHLEENSLDGGNDVLEH